MITTRDPAHVHTNEQRFAELYDAHYDEIHAFCARRVGTDAAGDTTNDTFAVVWRRIEEVPSDNARAWVYGVARGVVRNHWRSTSRRMRLGDRVRGLRTTDPDGPEQLVMASSRDDAVLHALRTLSDADQEILRLAAWEDLSGPEIAEVLGIRLAAVQQRLSRAKKRLAARLESTVPADQGGQA